METERGLKNWSMVGQRPKKKKKKRVNHDRENQGQLYQRYQYRRSSEKRKGY